MIELTAVHKRFGDGPPVLDGLNLRIAAGEFVSFVGPSGCGKSTLLRLLAGLSSPTSGRVTLEGTDATSTSLERGFVFQDPTLLPWLTAQENVALPLCLRGVPEKAQRERALGALSRVGLSSADARYPRELSGGQRMRVSLARALVNPPALLLLDEPFGALDELTRDRLNEDLVALRNQDRWSACFVTHSVSEAVFLSDRVILLAPNPGRIHADYTIDRARADTIDLRRSDSFHRQVLEISAALRAITP